jgi:hypothetical protein
VPSITKDVTLGHQAQKSSDASQVALAAGEQVSIIREFEHHYLVKTGDGKVFNVKKEFVDAGS